MLKLEHAIIVEGKYDKIRLSSLLDALIITTDGFHIFRDKENLELIRTLAQKNGLIVLTDSDMAGFKIRAYLNSAIPGGKIINVYIPDVFGRERRKEKTSAEGKLGVEGMDDRTLLQCFERAGVFARVVPERQRKITKGDFFEDGLTGKPDSSARRDRLKEKLSLPRRLSVNNFLKVMNALMSKDEYLEIVKNL
ncbi:MAG: DUF4093 domain-containing protein [Oscillospiraceae bacterium]|jgi:ribonuclease M5|nr:DUF4093 domain-containing protein [Oscillospiraceae bacterium]